MLAVVPHLNVVALLALTPAAGAPATPDDPSSWDTRAEPLLWGDVVTRAPTTTLPRHEASAPHLLYINFSDGTESVVAADTDSAPDNRSALGAVSPYPAFSWPSVDDGTESREAFIRSIVVDLQKAFLPYDIVLTTTRPTAGPYTMVLVGGTPDLFGFDGKVAGVALLDCENSLESNVVFAFAPVVHGNLHSLFVTIAQESAHSYGLEHTNNQEDLMFPKVDPRQESFPDVLSQVIGTGTCGRTTQNSHLQLLAAVGAWPGGDKPLYDGTFVDTQPPSLRVVVPAPNSLVPADFDVWLAANDAVGLERVELEAGGTVMVSAAPPFEWRVRGFPPGPLTLTATAWDTTGNKTALTLPVRVSAGAGDTAPGGCALAPGRGPTTVKLLGLGAVAGALMISACSRRRRRL